MCNVDTNHLNVVLLWTKFRFGKVSTGFYWPFSGWAQRRRRRARTYREIVNSGAMEEQWHRTTKSVNNTTSNLFYERIRWDDNFGTRQTAKDGILSLDLYISITLSLSHSLIQIQYVLHWCPDWSVINVRKVVSCWLGIILKAPAFLIAFLFTSSLSYFTHTHTYTCSTSYMYMITTQTHLTFEQQSNWNLSVFRYQKVVCMVF